MGREFLELNCVGFTREAESMAEKEKRMLTITYESVDI
jgi:hypothetical protein